MIGFLSGTIQDIFEKYVLLRVGGVGYEVFLSPDVLSESKVNNEASLYIHSVYREDEASLYGFESLEKREFFRLLLTVNGVGAKMGMEICSMDIAKVQGAIASEDEVYLTTVKGVGRKLASRIILELKGKVSMVAVVQGSATSYYSQELTDAKHALIELGYDARAVTRILSQLPPGIDTTEEMVKWGLKNL